MQRRGSSTKGAAKADVGQASRQRVHEPQRSAIGASFADGWLYEMRLGLDGVMTGMAMYADLMARMWELHVAGDADRLRDAYSRFLLMRNINQQIPGADLYVMQKRGIFKSTTTRTGGVAAWKPKALSVTRRDRGDRFPVRRR